MQRTVVRPRGTFRALTVVRRGRLSKDHLSDPKVGLSPELKREQAEPVEVELKPLCEVTEDRINRIKPCE